MQEMLYTIDFTSDGTVTSDFGTVAGNQVIDIPVGTAATLTTVLGTCSIQQTIVSPTCEPECSTSKCVQVIITKTNQCN